MLQEEFDLPMLVNKHRRSAVKIVNGGSGNSAVFPEVRLPSSFEWPKIEGEDLGLLFRLDLAELAAAHRFDWLPGEGTLFFFGHPDNYLEDNMFQVVYVAPQTPLVLHEGRDGDQGNRILVSFRPFDCLPSLERLGDFSEEQEDLYREERERFSGDLPRHWIGGYPEEVQNDDMEVDAELSRTGVRSSLETRLKAAEHVDDWHLLLQLDSDDVHGTHFVDSGIIYVFIHHEDAMKKDFSRIFSTCQFL